mmetsp:Transcript_2059/g.3644  ORF Transcript_2059/g.3644 Transcript_2059/m.3644 type:complete len:130 (+) Transcript_2059:117-506(+)
MKVNILKFWNHYGFNSEEIDTEDYFIARNVALIGSPGAFTPTCTTRFIPEYIKKHEEFMKRGTDEIIVLSVNDSFVLTAFAEYLGGKHKINFISDGNGEFSRRLGLCADYSFTNMGHVRTKRFSMVIKN